MARGDINNTKGRGKKFSSEYQPENNNGRPKNVFKKYHGMFECSAADVAAVLTELISQSEADLKKIANDKDTPALRSCIASAVLKDKENGTFTAMNFLAERLFGKAVQKTESAISINTDDAQVASVLSKHGIADKN